MRTVTLYDPLRGIRIKPVAVAETALERTRGLLARPAPAPGGGLLLVRCSSVHTFGMRYPIDVVFLDRNGRVVRIVPQLAPLRLAVCAAARHVLEMAGGESERAALRVGALLRGL